MFVSKKMPNNVVMPQSLVVLIVLVTDQWSLTRTMSTTKLYGFKAFFSISLETNKHQNFTELSHPVTNNHQNLMRLRRPTGRLINRWMVRLINRQKNTGRVTIAPEGCTLFDEDREIDRDR